MLYFGALLHGLDDHHWKQMIDRWELAEAPYICFWRQNLEDL